MGKTDGSVVVHSLESGSNSSKMKTELCAKSTNPNSVEDLQWDPLSTDYLLVGWKDGTMVMYDVSSEHEVVRFDKQNDGWQSISLFKLTSYFKGLKCILWLPNQPGCFVTAGDKTGIMKTWTVSQRQPIASIKVSSSLVTCEM